jgi:indolepyruvate ferredoxin oxidoreductase beta subunit
MTSRPIKLCIAALGGQGGGVLADWLIEIAEAEGHLVQSTSVPGVAQRTGATIYYLEFFPRAEAQRAGRDPIMALMPVPGDVDCVVASELVEAGRAIQRGLVDPQKTTLIASTHRSYSIFEKIALGQGAANEAELMAIIQRQAKHLVLFDMDAVAERHHTVISSVLLGAMCGSGVLPFRRQAFEAAIRKSGIAVEANLAAFAEACQRAERRDPTSPSRAAAGAGKLSQKGSEKHPEAVPAQARSPKLQPLLDRIRRLPEAVQAISLEGVRRAIDYQDPEYAALYLTRLERICALDESPWTLTGAVARSLALWMSFEDTIRVADLKTRAARFARVREEIRAEPDRLFGITEFMKPRVQEVAGTLPAAMGAWVLGSPRVSRWLERATGGKRVRTRTVSGFLLLHVLAAMRRWRRGTHRYLQEDARIEDWLARIARLAPAHRELAVELARAQRLIKGYGETHERGWRNYSVLVTRLGELAARPDGASVLARLHEAALADEEGSALARELTSLLAEPAARLGAERAGAEQASAAPP